MFKVPICYPSKIRDCLNGVKPDHSKCEKTCEGILVTSYEKDESHQNVESVGRKLIQDYDSYKMDIDFPDTLEGLLFLYFELHFMLHVFKTIDGKTI